MDQFNKSAHSGGGNCVEVAFRTSTHSSSGNCVEVGFRGSKACSLGNCAQVSIGPDAVHVRDSKDQDGPVLKFTYDEWAAFLAGVHGGEFELPVAVPEQREGVEA